MPTELEEIRLTAAQNLVPYSTSDPVIFKSDKLRPIRNLKVLTRDRPPIAQHALTILINLSADPEVLEDLVQDDSLIQLLLESIVSPQETNADLHAMLLANLAKSDAFQTLLHRTQQPPSELGSDSSIMNQLVDLFVKGQGRSYNPAADFDYLAYLFADLATHADLRRYFVEPQPYDGLIPLTKLKVFTEHQSDIRRKGVASAIKNVAFDLTSHPSFLSDSAIDILPYILLPIIGNEDYDADDTMAMLPDLQLLPPDKKREADPAIVQTHLETLTILTSTRPGRDLLRQIRVYPIIRETHLRVDDDNVRDACERLVQVLMRDEETQIPPPESAPLTTDDDDDKIIEV